VTETDTAPFNNVIVGIDGRQGGRDALALARLLLASAGDLTLAHVRKGGRFAPTMSDEAGEAESQSPECARSKGLLERERDRAAVAAQLADIVASNVGRGLHELAARLAADLLVVGSSHRGSVGRFLVADHTRASLNDAACAVAIAPVSYEHAAPRLAAIGVGYDGSTESKAALGLALKLARARRATVRALRVVPPPTWLSSGFVALAGAEVLDSELAASEKEMSALAGVNGNAVVGAPREELAALGREVDLLVTGSRSYGRLRRLVLGSTPNFLANHARSPLLVLPSAADLQTANGEDRRGEDVRARRQGQTAAVRT
jgi:nucleotide-binding universal stress UspA family protein